MQVQLGREPHTGLQAIGLAVPSVKVAPLRKRQETDFLGPKWETRTSQQQLGLGALRSAEAGYTGEATPTSATRRRCGASSDKPLCACAAASPPPPPAPERKGNFF